MRPALLALALVPLPALADGLPDAKAGAVAQFMAAQDLFMLGRSENDPLAVLAAARLAARLTPVTTGRRPDPAAAPLPPAYPDATTMFTAARALAAEDGALTDLADRSAAEAPRLPARSLQQSSTGIPAGESQTYALSFFGGVLAEIGLLGDGKANLDLTVTDAAERPLCIDSAPDDHALCSFVLTENASVTATVTNRSETAASYTLLTN